MSTKPSVTEKELEAAVGNRIVEDHPNGVEVVDLVVELLEQEEDVTRGEAMLTEGVTGVLLLTMVLRNQLRKRTLFR